MEPRNHNGLGSDYTNSWKMIRWGCGTQRHVTTAGPVTHVGVERTWSWPWPWTSGRSWGVRRHRFVLPIWSVPLQPHSRHFERRKPSLLFTVCGCWWDRHTAWMYLRQHLCPCQALCHSPGLCTSPCAPGNILHWSWIFSRRKRAPHPPVLGRTPSPNATLGPRFAGCCWC